MKNIRSAIRLGRLKAFKEDFLKKFSLGERELS
jgi:queuine/archaeosine tRNA-ribosyltransferase